MVKKWLNWMSTHTITFLKWREQEISFFFVSTGEGVARAYQLSTMAILWDGYSSCVNSKQEMCAFCQFASKWFIYTGSWWMIFSHSVTKKAKKLLHVYAVHTLMMARDPWTPIAEWTLYTGLIAVHRNLERRGGRRTHPQSLVAVNVLKDIHIHVKLFVPLYEWSFVNGTMATVWRPVPFSPANVHPCKYI